MALSHLDALEAEAIHIFREVAATCARPVMLYSIGKDSSVLLHTAIKAFAPGPIPFPLLHVDTGWKFREMIAFRDRMAAEHGLDLKVYMNPDGVRDGVGPFSHGSSVHTHVMKTLGLRQALDAGRYDAAFGGARRDEEKSRAKERIFSFRDRNHGWDPKNQRPEMWQYIQREAIPIVPLYFAKPRPVVERDGMLIMADDERMVLRSGESVEQRVVRFRTLGCYPLTGAIESEAASLDDIIAEMQVSRTSERQGRLIDRDEAGSMEKKKREGYF